MELACAQAQRENERLVHENDTLKREIEALRSQFAEAVKLSNQFEESAKENVQHVETIQSLNEKIGDLTSRLRISAQSREDLKDSFDRERAEANRQFEQQIELLKQEITERKNDLLVQERESKRKVEEIEKAKVEAEMKLKKAEIELKQIYASASQYFEEPVDDINKIVERFVKVKEVPVLKEPVQEKKCRCAKRKQKIKRLEEQIRYLNETHLKELRDLRAEFDQKESTMNLRFQETENRCERVSEQCEMLKQEKSKLIQEAAKLKTQLKCAAVEAETKRIDENLESEQKIKRLTTQLMETDEKNDTLKKQLQPLMKRVKALQATVKTQEQTLAGKDEEMRTLNEKFSAVSLDLDETSTERDRLKGELTNLHERFQDLLSTAKEYKESLNEIRAENRRLDTSLVSTTHELETSKADLESTRKERDELAEIIESQNKALRQNEALASEQKATIEKLSLDLEDSKQRLVHAVQPINEASLLPLAIEAVENLPEELAKILIDITKNPTIKAPTMLKQVLSVMNQWYQSASQRTRNELGSQKERNGQMSTGLNDFAQMLMRAFPRLDCDFGQVLEDESIRRKIENAIREMEVSIATEKEDKGKLESRIVDLLVEIGADDPGQAKTVVFDMKKELDDKDSQINDVKTKLRSYQKLMKAKQTQHEEEVGKLNGQIKDMETQMTKLKEEYETLQADNSRLNSENTALTEHYEQAMQDQMIQHEAQMKESQASLERLVEEVKLAKGLRQRTEESKVQMEEQMQHLQNTIYHLNSGMDKKNQDVEKMKKKLTEVAGKAKDRIEAEREVIQRKSEKIINHIQSKVTELTTENTRLKKSNTKLEERQEVLRSENEELAMKLQACEMRVESLEKDFEREKKLLSSQMKTQLRANENQFHKQLDELRVKLQDAKRNLIAFVANNFCTLFDVKNVLDDSSFEPFIINIRTKLSSLLALEANLRELLNLGPNQSIEDSVSSLLLAAAR